jgi:hypothetical protein
VVFAENPILTGMDNRQSSASRFSVRPNPASGSVEVYAFGFPDRQSFPIQLLTMTGTMVNQYQWDGKSVRINLSGLPEGMYFLKIRTTDSMEMKKLIVQ